MSAVTIAELQQQLDLMRQQNELLFKQSTFYEDIIHKNQDFVCRYDTAYRLTFVNQAFSARLGIATEQLIGQSILDWLPASRRGDSIQNLRRLSHEHPDASSIHEWLTPDGSVMWIEWTDSAILNEQGEIVAYQGVGRDVSARKLAEEALRRSEAHQRAIIKAIPELMFYLDAEGRFLDYQAPQKQLLAMEPDFFLGKCVEDVFPPERAKTIRDYVNLALRTQQVVQFEYSMIINSKLHHFVATMAPFEYDRVIVLIRDISDRRQLELELENRVFERTQQLDEERRLLINLIDSIPDMIYVKDQQHRYVVSNQANTRALGCEYEDEVLGKTDFHFLPHEKAQQTQQTEQVIFSTGNSLRDVEDSDPYLSNGFEQVVTSKFPLHNASGDLTGLIGVTRDITNQNKTEAMLEQKYTEEQVFHASMRKIHQMMVELTSIDDLDTFYRTVVELGTSQLDFDRFSLFLYDARRHYAVCTYGVNDAGQIVAAHDVQFEVPQNSLLSRSMAKPTEYELVPEAPLWMGTDLQVGTGWNAAVSISHNGKHLGWLVADNLVQKKAVKPYQLDVMAQYGVLVGAVLARKMAEQMLRESDWQHRQMFEQMGAGITMYDAAGKLIYVNDRICMITGYSREELLEHGVDMTIDPEHDPIWNQHGDLRDQGYSSTYELRLIRKDKSRVTILVNGSPQFDLNGVQIGSFAVSIDISAQKEAQEMLQRALRREKDLAQIQSQFVATTSHEFRTPLAVILATTETLQQYRDQMNTDQVNLRLERIRSQIYHLRQIMDNVLNLSAMQHRRGEFAPKLGDIRALFEQIAAEFRGSMDFVDRLRIDMPDMPIEIPYEPRMMRQIMQNLISNALKYSPQERPVDLTLKREGDEIVIQVRDYGIGIPAESMARLFQPFQRATNVGRISGTGLGLVIVKESVEIHGGTISIDSIVNEGTLVTIRIPVKQMPDESAN